VVLSVISTKQGGTAVTSSGLLFLLLPLLKNPHHLQNYRLVSRAVRMIDIVLFDYAGNFGAFCDAEGPSLVVERIKSELELCEALQQAHSQDVVMEEDTGPLPELTPFTDTYWPPRLLSRLEEGHKRLTLLRSLFKFLLHAWMATGTADRMRPLIDSSLPKSIRVALENPKVYGAGVYSTAAYLLSTIIHNEPTSLNTLQEMGLQKAFFSHLADSVTTNNEVLTALPGLISAFCLNTAGLDAFVASNSLASFLRIFYLPEYLPIMSSEDLPDILGRSVDELVRHQPDLKDHVLAGVHAVLNKITALGEDVTSEPEGVRSQFSLESRFSPFPAKKGDKTGDKKEAPEFEEAFTSQLASNFTLVFFFHVIFLFCV